MKRKIISSRETAELAPEGTLQRIRVVEYMLDEYGPFIYEVPREEFSWDKLRADMKTNEDEIKKTLQSS